MRRAHAVAAVVEEATGQNGGRPLEPDATCSIWQRDRAAWRADLCRGGVWRR
jgi:hypothetical protein